MSNSDPKNAQKKTAARQPSEVARKGRRPPKRQRLAAKRGLLDEAAALLESASSVLATPARWSRLRYALDSRGQSVCVDDPSAVRFCLAGALLRAEHQLHGTAIPIRTDPAPEIDDLDRPALPEDCPTRLRLAMQILSLAAGDWLASRNFHVSILYEEMRGARLPATLHLPLYVGLQPSAKHADCSWILDFARLTCNWIDEEDARVDTAIGDAAVFGVAQ